MVEAIFSHVLGCCINPGLIDPSEIFVDDTHIKAAANNHKYINQEVNQQAKFMADQLEFEINRDREKHAKKWLGIAKEKSPKLKKSQRQTQKVAGFIRENINKSLLIMPKLPVISMVGH